ncbi:hypothetical protein M0802_007364 [Mischocyttarus mexicanus]|nr:hypothetical protein M0802_007364 [Mischocyttarus mexicanus]
MGGTYIMVTWCQMGGTNQSKSSLRSLVWYLSRVGATLGFDMGWGAPALSFRTAVVLVAAAAAAAAAVASAVVVVVALKEYEEEYKDEEEEEEVEEVEREELGGWSYRDRAHILRDRYVNVNPGMSL